MPVEPGKRGWGREGHPTGAMTSGKQPAVGILPGGSLGNKPPSAPSLQTPSGTPHWLTSSGKHEVNDTIDVACVGQPPGQRSR